MGGAQVSVIFLPLASAGSLGKVTCGNTQHTQLRFLFVTRCGAESGRPSHHGVWEQVSGKEDLRLLLPEQRQNVGFRDSRPELNKELDYLVSEHRVLKKGLWFRF